MRHFDAFASACVEVGGSSPDLVGGCDSEGARLAMIGAGLGIGMVTELSSEVPVPGVVFRAVEDLQRCLRWFLAWRADDTGRVLQEFIEVVRQLARRAGSGGTEVRDPDCLRWWHAIAAVACSWLCTCGCSIA